MSIDKKILSTMQEENDMTQKEAGSTGKRHLHSTLFSVSAGQSSDSGGDAGRRWGAICRLSS